MLYRPYQSVRLNLLNPPLNSTHSYWSATGDVLGHSSIPRWHASIRPARRQGGLGVVCCMEQGFCQGCMLAPLLFSIFSAAVKNVTSTRFKADKGIMDALVHLRQKKVRGGGGKQLLKSQSWRRRLGVCFMLTMPGSYRNHASS